MSLGLNSLTDDQLLNLLQEACNELAARDPIVRNIAQSTILDEGAKVKAARVAVDAAAEKVRQEYIHDLFKDVEAEVRRQVKAGELKLAGIDEAKLIADADAEARKTLEQEILEARRANAAPSTLIIEIVGNRCNFRFDGRRGQFPCALTQQKFIDLQRHLLQVLP